MSVSYYKFPERTGATDDSNIEIYGAMRYNKDDGLYMSVPNAVAVSFYPNATGPDDPWTEMDVFAYGNGASLKFNYQLYVTEYTGGHTYHLDAWARLYNDRGEITSYTRIAALNVNKSVLDTKTPFENCYYVPGVVIYATNTPSIVGEEAIQVSFGALYIENILQLMPVDLFGEHKWASFQGTWAEYQWLTCTNDQIYDQRDDLFKNSEGDSPYSPSNPDDGYDPSKPSKPGGGDKPTYGPDDGDPIDFPDLPTVSALTTGMITAYKVDGVDIAHLASELWSNSFIDSIQKIMNDPFDALIGLTMFPVDVSAGGPGPIKIGNFTSETANAGKISAQFIAVSGGDFTLEQCWYNFLDFTQTNVSIFLPFVGIRQLQADDVMGNTIEVQYNLDVVTGAGAAFVKCGESVLYTFPCQVGYDIPLTGSNKAALYTGLMNVAMSAVTGAIIGNVPGAMLGAATGAVSTAASKQSDVERSGSMSGNGGVLGDFNCYLIIHRPVQSLPENFKQYKGYKSYITKQLAHCKGFTKVDSINLAVAGATDAELTEIETLLKAGVLI